MPLFGCASDEQFLDELHSEIFSNMPDNPYKFGMDTLNSISREEMSYNDYIKKEFNDCAK